MEWEHLNLYEYLSVRDHVQCEFIDIRDERIKNLAIGDGRGLGPFRVGITPQLQVWMARNNIPTDKQFYPENLFMKRVKYYFLFIINNPRPWLAQHMPEWIRKIFRRILRK